MNELREKLAELAHKQWSGWMRYLFDSGVFNDDGTWTMPAWAVERWKRQMEMPYSKLSEKEQISDRKEADKVLVVVEAGLCPDCGGDGEIWIEHDGVAPFEIWYAQMKDYGGTREEWERLQKSKPFAIACETCGGNDN